MIQWIAGNTEECWTKAFAVEQDRASRRRSARRPKRYGENTDESVPTDTKRKHLRAKKLVNHGEWSKAMGALLSNGTAEITDNVLSQPREKHPPRVKPIADAGPYPGWAQPTEDTQVLVWNLARTTTIPTAAAEMEQTTTATPTPLDQWP